MNADAQLIQQFVSLGLQCRIADGLNGQYRPQSVECINRWVDRLSRSPLPTLLSARLIPYIYTVHSIFMKSVLEYYPEDDPIVTAVFDTTKNRLLDALTTCSIPL